jgi:hypothetical protein
MVVSQTEHKLQLWEEGIRRKSQGKDPAEDLDMDEEKMVIEDETIAVDE